MKDIAERLVRSGVTAVPVVEADGVLVGIVTEADLIAKPALGDRRSRSAAVIDLLSGRTRSWAAKASGMTAADLMTRDVMVCQPDDDVRAVARRMLQRGVKSIPVMAGELVGMVSRRDILRMYDRTDSEIITDIATLDYPDNSTVDIEVADGVVTLAGRAMSPVDVSVVAAEVERVRGVTAVVNHLEADDVRRPSRSR